MIRDGYSICFNEWALDVRIKNELPLLLIISSLTAKTGECFASNKYFAELFNCTEVSISQKIAKLIKFDYIIADYEKRGAEIIKRKLRLKKFLTDDLKSFYPTIKKDFKDKNISIKNNNIYIQEFEEFWKYYPKQRAGSKSKAYTSFCRAIKEKRITIERLLVVVKKYATSKEVEKGFAKGCAAWLNDDRFNQDYEQTESEQWASDIDNYVARWNRGIK